MKNLYLATYDTNFTPYMGDTRKQPKKMSLIWADNEQEAEEKLRKEVEYYGYGDDSCSIHSLEIEQAISRGHLFIFSYSKRPIRSQITSYLYRWVDPSIGSLNWRG